MDFRAVENRRPATQETRQAPIDSKKLFSGKRSRGDSAFDDRDRARIAPTAQSAKQGRHPRSDAATESTKLEITPGKIGGGALQKDAVFLA